jgi:hypothetical protein
MVVVVGGVKVIVVVDCRVAALCGSIFIADEGSETVLQ